MAKWDTTELLTELKLRGFVTASQGSFTDANLLQVISREIETEIAALMHSVGWEYGIHVEDQAMVVGDAGYRIPSRAIGNSIRSVWRVDGSGKEFPLDPLAPERIPHDAQFVSNGCPTHYYFENSEVKLYPPPDRTDILRMKYQVRPSRLVASGSYNVLTAVAANSLTAAANGAALATGDLVDVVRATPNFEILVMNGTVTVSGAGPYTFAVTAPTSLGIAVGDYLCKAGETGVPIIPDILHLLAGLYGARVYANSTGKHDLASRLDKEIESKKVAALKLMSPRNQSHVQRMVGRRWL